MPVAFQISFPHSSERRLQLHVTMRTRFLGIDCFSYASNHALESVEYLRLSPPHLPPLNPSIFEDYVRCFDDASSLSVSLEIDTPPIDNALSKFFSDVLPRFIDVEIEDFANTHSRSGEARNDEQRNSRYQDRAEVLAPEEQNEPIFCCKEEHCFEVVQFEMPELDLSSENAYFYEEEKMQLFAAVVDVDNNVDTLNPLLMLPHPFETLESVYSVGDITAEYSMEQKTFMLEDAGSAQEQVEFHINVFPLLEVDEISLGIFGSISMEDEFLLLENIEPQDGPQRGEVMVDGKELLGSADIDILEYLLDHCLSKGRFEASLSCSNFRLELDLIGIIELSYIAGNPGFQQLIPDENSKKVVTLIKFEETQFLEFDLYPFLEVFNSSANVFEAETCEHMFIETSNFRNFNDLIVSHELTLVDESFKSLPIPILSDHEKIRSPFVVVEETLAALKLHPPSVSDGIYLDWHLLEEDSRNCDKFSSCWEKVLEISSYSIDFDIKSLNEGIWVFDFVFSGDSPNGANIVDNKETLDVLLSGGISAVSGCPNDVSSSNLFNDGCQKHGNGEALPDINAERVNGNGEVLPDINAERVSKLVEAVAPFNDLNFFLNPREATTGRTSKPALKAFNGNSAFPAVSSTNPIAQSATTAVQLHQWDLKLHHVKLSDNILELLGNFKKNYLAILKGIIELTKTQLSCLTMDDTELLGLPKEKLMDCIKETNGQGTLSHADDNTAALITLCAIKQMAWYLCYYGVHTTYLYADKLSRTLDSVKHKIGFLQILIEDMHGKAERDIIACHPSLSLIQDVLQSNLNDHGFKVLIVAEVVFWWPLKRLLASMQISYIELQNFCTHASQHNLCYNNKLMETKADFVLHSACCLISNEHISASFPFDKFSVILEYGGSCGSSKVSTISTKLAGFLCLHFLKVDLEESSDSKALCEGVDMPWNIGISTELEELLNFVPSEDMGSSEAADGVKAFCLPLPVPCVPSATELGHIHKNMSSFQDTVIVVNTQNLDKEMIISRRSTYQRILEIEKEGAQVVERDLKLPVDIIISAAICLIWYDCRSIWKKATAPSEASSCLPLCVENIATNVLTSLSFAFSGCVLVFEGENSFLAAVMESSDELYAAAASLRIDLQLFFSYSSKLTDEIILNCIGCATNLSSCTYAKMPESETRAESFLTAFPSIHPLSAHAILTSGSILVEFLEWSHERRFRAIQKYNVPDESVTLLSALCRYGEREDSRSGMTDCSSSVSSPPDSRNCCRNIDSVGKKRKYIRSPHKIDTPIDDLFHFEQFPERSLNNPQVSRSCDTWMLGSEEPFDEIDNVNVSYGDKLFSQKQGSGPSDVAAVMKPSKICKSFSCRTSRGTWISDETKNHRFTLDDKLFGHDIAPRRRLNCHYNNNCANLQEDFIGEVIDATDSFSVGEDFYSSANSMDLSDMVPEKDKDSVSGKLRSANKLSFSKSSLPTFPKAAEIDCDSSDWISVTDHGKRLREGNQYADADFSKLEFPLKHQEEKLLEEGLIQKTSTNFSNLLLQRKDTQQHGGTALSNAIRSAQPQQGSPWTIEFLNKMREKSRLRQLSLPHDMSGLCLSYSGNISKVPKRKSPSILDFYKYQGGSIPRKIIEQKRQKRSTRPSTSSKNDKSSTSFGASWTPLDKRARRTLSFSVAGAGVGSQRKLVWSDKDGNTTDRRFYH